MAAVVDTTAILPGGEGQIKVTLDVGSHVGEVAKSIRVISNDPRRRTSTIHVRTFVELNFEFVMPSLYFGRIGPADQKIESAYLRVKDPSETEILNIENKSPLVSVRKVGYGNTEENSDKYEIEVTIGPGLPVGQFLDSVVVHSNLTDRPPAVLRVLGLVLDGVEVKPQTLSFMVFENDKSNRSRTKTAYILNYQKNLPLEILDVIDEEHHVDVEISPTEENQRFKLTITLIENTVPEAGNLNGTIKIITNNPQFKELLIPYSAVWRN
jgi:hypothetical protein